MEIHTLQEDAAVVCLCGASQHQQSPECKERKASLGTRHPGLPCTHTALCLHLHKALLEKAGLSGVSDVV